MTADEARAMYRRQVKGTFILRRYNPSPTPPTNTTVRARVTGYTRDELVNGIAQGERKVIMLAEDVPSGLLPLRTGGGDRIVFNGRELNIDAVDDATRAVDGELIAFELAVSG